MLNDQQKYQVYEKLMQDVQNNKIILKDLFKILNHQQKLNLLTQCYCLDQKENIQMIQQNTKTTLKENEKIWLECLCSNQEKNGQYLHDLKVSDGFLINISSKYISKLMKKNDDVIADYIQNFPTIFLKNFKLACLYAVKQNCQKSSSLLTYICQKEEDCVFFLGCLVSFDQMNLLNQFENKPFIHQMNRLIDDKDKLFDHLRKKGVTINVQNMTASFNQYLCDFINKEISVEEASFVKRKLKKL